MASKRGRTQTCGAPQARRRLAQARSYMDVARLTADERDPNLEYAAVAASVAILAGIAAADAACCQALGRRSRSDNHHDAEALLAEITPGGKDAAKHLRQLIDIKDAATTASSASRPPSSNAPCAKPSTSSGSPSECGSVSPATMAGLLLHARAVAAPETGLHERRSS